MGLRPTEFAAVVGHGRAYLDVDINDRNRAFAELPDVKEAENMAAVGVDNSLHADLARR